MKYTDTYDQTREEMQPAVLFRQYEYFKPRYSTNLYHAREAIFESYSPDTPKSMIGPGMKPYVQHKNTNNSTE